MLTNVKFAILLWTDNAGSKSVHPDDLQALQKNNPIGQVLQVVEPEGKYIKVRYGDRFMRVLKDCLKPIPHPSYCYNETVETLPPRTHKVGQIKKILWHHKLNECMYYLEVDDKLSKSRYSANELKRFIVA